MFYLFDSKCPRVDTNKPTRPYIIVCRECSDFLDERGHLLAKCSGFTLTLTALGKERLEEVEKTEQPAIPQDIIRAFRESCNASATTATDKEILDSIEIVSRRTLTGTSSVTISLFRGTVQGTGTTEDEAWASLLTSLKRRSKFVVQTPGSEKLTFSLDFTCVVVVSNEGGPLPSIHKRNIAALLEGLQKAKELLD